MVHAEFLAGPCDGDGVDFVPGAKLPEHIRVPMRGIYRFVCVRDGRALYEWRGEQDVTLKEPTTLDL